MDASTLKRLSGNAGALLAIQLANALLPLVLAPYLTRVLGRDGYGAFAFGAALIQFAAIITDYGFGISAVYQISRARGHRERIRRIAGAVLLVKLALFALVSVAVIGYVMTTDHVPGGSVYIILLLISILGLTLQPVWLFQALEKMASVTIYIVASRLAFVLLVLLFCRSADDLPLVAVLNGTGYLFAALAGLYVMRGRGLAPRWPGLKRTRVIAGASTEYFWSRIAVVSYGAGATIFLGVFGTASQVAIFSVAEQFYRGAIAIYSPVTQAIYPYMARSRDIALFRKIFVGAFFVAVLGVAFGIICGPMLISMIFGEGYQESYPVLVVFLLALLAAIPSILLGYPFLGALGQAKVANRSVFLAGFVQVLALGAIYFLGVGSALTVVIAVLLAESSALIWRARAAYPYLKA
ncbi:oligosaccharide flippase family protein [Stenotrophomonas riyadhensis]|uniref:Oligosaccharide flippase family protein n=1 Tax=Stenotrophomonas maltophilia TaxID=40324 RepID=A0AAI9C407_STEMA|nr:oligosaccharide flippase family protein [Stenotrophomonas maltophilia]UUS16182.1 oligosaccharide flippase family protein [Stenotrophomonas sp. CD2]HEL4101397.1 oligosaccharide flippase family protein [Stenotrophomonas maltophilia]HEL5043084.1 oligosaccharide flippase family protein [Stenotrophomonas maltophilia]